MLYIIYLLLLLIITIIIIIITIIYIYYVWGILYVWGLNTWSEEKFIESIDLRISKWTQVIIEFSSGKLSATTQGNVLNDEVAGKQRWEVGMVSWKVFSCGVVGHLGFHDTLLFTWELQVNGCELMLMLRDKVEIYVYIYNLKPSKTLEQLKCGIQVWLLEDEFNHSFRKDTLRVLSKLTQFFLAK